MRTLARAFALGLFACSNSPAPRVIAGGGIGDGDIDGALNVYIIDNDTYQPIQDATVEVEATGANDQTTDDTGLALFQDLHGAQTITVKAAGYRGAVWEGANGANITVPVTKLGTLTPQQATLSGSINGWDTVSVPAGQYQVSRSFSTRRTTTPPTPVTTSRRRNMAGNSCEVGVSTCTMDGRDA